MAYLNITLRGQNMYCRYIVPFSTCDIDSRNCNYRREKYKNCSNDISTQ